MRKFIGVSAVLVCGGVAFGQNFWNEVGDAPALLPGQAVTGPPKGDLEFIHGSFLGAGDVDLYQIFIHRPALFNASTVDFTTADTQLFLFDLNGNGVTHNDDNVMPGIGLQSRITGLFVTAPGIYYLAITQYNNDPLNPANALIWNNTPFRSERRPDGPGAPGPLDSWTTSGIGGAFSYTIELSGVLFIPAPGAMALLGLGGLFAMRRRRG